MADTNHVCTVCKKEYLYCDDCGEFSSYKTICCSEEHYKVFLIVKKYNKDHNKKSAFESLSAIHFDKSTINTFAPSIQNALKEIYTFSVKEEKNNKETSTEAPKQTYKNNNNNKHYTK